MSGQGQMHVEMAVARLKKRYGVEVLCIRPKYPTVKRSRARRTFKASIRNRAAVTASTVIAKSGWSDAARERL